MMFGMFNVSPSREAKGRMSSFSHLESQYYGLPSEIRENGAHRHVRDLNQSHVRRVHFQDQENRTRNRQRGEKQAANCRRIERGIEAETDKNDAKPENQHDQ